MSEAPKYQRSGEETRLSRGADQYENEEEILNQANGLSAPERYLLIRDKIFRKYKNIEGDNSVSLVRNMNVSNFPEGKRIGEVYLPKFFTVLDSLEDAINESSEEKSAKGLRLAVVSRLLGILIHNAPDGNYQTTELMALSYVRQFCPEFSNSFFPIKYTSENPEHKDHLASTGLDMLRKGRSLPIETDRVSKRLLQIARHIVTKENQIIHTDTGAVSKLDVLKAYLVRLVPILEKSGVLAKSGMSAEDLKKEIKSAPYPSEAKQAITIPIADFLEAKYPGNEMQSTALGSRNEAHMGAAYLEFFLNTQTGRVALEKYVLTGELPIVESTSELINTEAANEMINSFVNAVEKSVQIFRDTLKGETAEVHQQKYQARGSVQEKKLDETLQW